MHVLEASSNDYERKRRDICSHSIYHTESIRDRANETQLIAQLVELKSVCYAEAVVTRSRIPGFRSCLRYFREMWPSANPSTDDGR